MRLQETTLDQFVLGIREKSQKIIIYGAGVIGKNVVPTFLEEHKLQDTVLFIADADAGKQGTCVYIGGKEIEICSPEKMNVIKESFAVLVTGSRYENILIYLEQMEMLFDVDVYIFPQMLIKECRYFEKKEVERKSQIPIIPKNIHYCWFGRGVLPDELKRYRESWERFCPDYHIIEWNEDTYDVEKHRFTRQAYKNRKWAFVSDVAKLEILYEHGGIYLDTDVELIRSLDELLYQPGFVGVEKWGIINIGGGCGVVPKHPMIKMILEYYKKMTNEQENGGAGSESSGSYESKPLLDYGFRPNNTIQTVNDMTIYTSDFFHPYDYMSKELCITENTYGIHHYAQSWI